MAEHELLLQESQLFSDRTDPVSQLVSTAVFLVRAYDTASGREGDYRLTVMNNRDFQAWQLEHEHLDTHDLSDEQEPLLVSDEHTVASGGLVKYIYSSYLNPQHPSEINRIKDHLVGPISRE